MRRRMLMGAGLVAATGLAGAGSGSVALAAPAAASHHQELGPLLFAGSAGRLKQAVTIRNHQFVRSTGWILDRSDPRVRVETAQGWGRSGSWGGRVIVPAGVRQPSWSGFRQNLTGIAVGSEVTVGCWVKISAVKTNGVGAYVCLDYFDRAGKRISWEQSSARRGTADWWYVTLTGHVPRGATTVRIGLVLNGTGTAWFDGVTVTRSVAARPAHAPVVTATLTSTVLNSRVQGAGHQLNPHAFVSTWNRMSTAQREQLRSRTKALSPDVIRVFVDCGWMVQGKRVDYSGPQARALYETCRFAESVGARVNLVMWRPNDWSMKDLKRPGEVISTVVDWLVAEGVRAVDLVTMWNEPTYEFKGTAAQFVDIFRNTRRSLDARGHRGVGLVAENYGGPLTSTSSALAPHIEHFGYHHYLDYREDLAKSVAQFTAFRDLVKPTGKPVWLWEGNIKASGSNWTAATVDGELVVERYRSALKLVTYYLHLLANGASGVSHWDLLDYAYGGDNRPQRFGMMGTASEGLPVRATYQLYQWLCRPIVPGSSITRVDLKPADSLVAYSATAPDGRRTTWLINPWSKPVDARLAGAGRASVTAVLTAPTWRAGGAPAPSVAAMTACSSTLAVRLPAESMVVVQGPSAGRC